MSPEFDAYPDPDHFLEDGEPFDRYSAGSAGCPRCGGCDGHLSGGIEVCDPHRVCWVADESPLPEEEFCEEQREWLYELVRPVRGEERAALAAKSTGSPPRRTH